MVLTGTLPAFAQISPPPGIPPTTANSILSGPLGACDAGGGLPGNLYIVTCDYSDPDGDMVANQARVRTVFIFPSGATNVQEATLDPINITGDGFNGTITVPLCINFGNNPNVNLTISFFDAEGLPSNAETLNIPAASAKLKVSDITPQGVIIVQR